MKAAKEITVKTIINPLIHHRYLFSSPEMSLKMNRQTEIRTTKVPMILSKVSTKVNSKMCCILWGSRYCMLRPKPSWTWKVVRIV